MSFEKDNNTSTNASTEVLDQVTQTLKTVKSISNITLHPHFSKYCEDQKGSHAKLLKQLLAQHQTLEPVAKTFLAHSFSKQSKLKNT